MVFINEFFYFGKRNFFFRGKDNFGKKNLFSFYEGKMNSLKPLSEHLEAQDVSYFFTPTINGNNEVSLKLRIGNNIDEEQLDVYVKLNLEEKGMGIKKISILEKDSDYSKESPFNRLYDVFQSCKKQFSTYMAKKEKKFELYLKNNQLNSITPISLKNIKMEFFTPPNK